MSDRRKNDRHRRSHSPSRTRDEDADFQFALRLSAELNGDLGGHAEAAAAAAKRQTEYDDDFDFVVQMQFNDEGETKANGRASSYLPDASTPSLALPQPGATDKTQVTTIEPETSAGRTFKSLADFQDYLKASQCTHCGDNFLRCESDASKFFQEWYEGKGALSFLRCRTCGIPSCIACPSTVYSKRSLAVVGSKSVSWCCENSRLLLIWLLLCGFDIYYCETKIMSAKENDAAKKKPEPPSKVKNKGKGKAKVGQSAQHSGIGYGGNGGYPGYSLGLDEFEAEDFAALPGGFSDVLKQMKQKTSRFNAKSPGRTISDQKSQAFEAQQAMDKLGTTVFSLLRHILPSLDRGHSFDMDPPAMITEMILESKILDYCTDMLRNDSLDDAFSRKTAYDALLDFVKVIGMHYTTASLTIFTGKPRQPELCNLLTQTYRHVEASSSETAPSIADSLRELSKLSDLLVKDAEHHKTIYTAGSDHELLCLCFKISELWKSLSAHILTTDSEASHTAAPTTPSGEVAAIADVTDHQICASHAFATKAQAQFRSALGRFKCLVSEINVLDTSLPPNIFVRHGESRLDVMKCVIIGPRDTPYENGIFEFDIFCPAEYPNVPPLVSFKGTGGGVHGINPNLYADGKVCLSLLGTWSGEPWKPGESTLLQVLVSLQAMVFCEQPWYNEPGRERSYGRGHANSASEAYNSRLRELTVRLAMLGWLEKAPRIWEDVVEQHFKANADKILRTVIEWSGKSRPNRRVAPPGLPDYLSDFHVEGRETGYCAILPELHERLQRYGATVALPEFHEEDAEPQSKKPRVEGSRPEGSQISTLPPAPGSLSSYCGLDPAGFGFDGDEDVNIASDMDDYDDYLASFEALRGGYRGRGTHHPGYSFLGRGQVLGARPGDHSSAPSAPSGGSDGGRGRGRGRGFFSWFGRGGAIPDPVGPPSSLHGLRHGTCRRPGDEDDKTDCGGRGGGFGRGGSGGRGGRGGSGSSKA